MDEKYWDKVAVDYDSEIFNVLANDRDEIIVSYVSKFGSEKKAACDFGCGVGKFLPVLAENFRHVYAIDISGSLLSQAKEACDGFDNISYFKKDLSIDKLKPEQVDFALCVNVLIMPDSEIRAGIIKAISEHLRKGGYFLLVVPSLESALYTDFRLLQWNLKEGMDYQESIEELQDGDSTDLELRQGLIEIDGVATKHFLKEELLAMFKDRAFEIISVEKVQYSWKTEFEKPPRWMAEPYPWDWLIILKKVKK